MEDNKDKELDENLPKDKNENPQAENDIELKEEMEDLAKTFQIELNKAKAEAQRVAQTEPEEPEILIQELEDIPEDDVHNESGEEIPEDELCECCGEKRRGTKENPDSQFCIDCDRGLRHYPFSWLYLVLALIVIAFSFFACYTFASYTSVYVSVNKADRLVKQHKLYSAYEAYATAANDMVTSHINGENVYKRSLDNAFKAGALDAGSDLTKQFKPWELKMPHFRTTYNQFEEIQQMMVTLNEGQYILYQYQDITDVKQIPYDEIIGKLDALLTVAPNDNPDSYTKLSGGETTTAPYNINATKYSKPMILYMKNYVSSLCQRDINEQIGYLEEIRNEYPELIWLYSTALGDLYTKAGKDTNELCQQLRKTNQEDSTADLIEVKSFRIKGNYDSAIALCQKLINDGDDTSYEFYRQEALCYLAMGKYTDAYNNANYAYQIMNSSTQVCNTLALCSAAVGNEETYNEMSDLFTSNKMTLSEEVIEFKDGKTTLDDILLKGDFDIQ